MEARFGVEAECQYITAARARCEQMSTHKVTVELAGSDSARFMCASHATVLSLSSRLAGDNVRVAALER